MEAVKSEKLKSYKDFLYNLRKDITFARLGKTFNTTKNKYFYDTGTGKVLKCSEGVYKVLKYLEKDETIDEIENINLSESELIEALKDIRAAVENQNILKAPIVKKFHGPNVNRADVKRYISEGVQQIALELTERCNLRCDYCIYNSSNDIFRDFGTKDMSWETAKKALDYAATTCGDSIAVTFYGGEPLLRFELIKKCVDYSKELFKGKDLSFAMTSNMVLMSKEYAKYFAGIKDFIITCSLDGNKEIHNEHRKFPNGEGSFDKTFKGLKNLVDALGKEAETRLVFSMVANPPYDYERFDAIQDFFDSIEWLPKRISKTISYVQYKRANTEIEVYDDDVDDNYVDPLGVWKKNKMNGSVESIESDKLFNSASIRKNLLEIHKRRLCEVPMDNFTFNACCVPGSRRLYVTTEGNFKLCEKIGESPYIGNVNDGTDLDLIMKNYVEDYMKESVEYCSKCWAVHLCTICYAECYDANGVNLNGKHQLCESCRYGRRKDLELYHEVLENNPSSLEFLNELETK